MFMGFVIIIIIIILGNNNSSNENVAISGSWPLARLWRLPSKSNVFRVIQICIICTVVHT